MDDRHIKKCSNHWGYWLDFQLPQAKCLSCYNFYKVNTIFIKYTEKLLISKK